MKIKIIKKPIKKTTFFDIKPNGGKIEEWMHIKPTYEYIASLVQPELNGIN